MAQERPLRASDFERPDPKPGEAGRLTRYLDEQSTVSEVTELVEQLRRDYQARDRLYLRTDEVLWSTYALNVPDAYRATTKEIRSPLQLNVANTIAAALSVNPQQVHFEPVGRGQQALDNQALRQHFFEASWNRQEAEAERSLLRLFLWNVISKGEGILKTVRRDQRAWASYAAFANRLAKRMADPKDGEYGHFAPERAGRSREAQRRRDAAYDRATDDYKRDAPYPIASTDVPPETFYPWLTSDGFSLVAEVSEAPYLDALSCFGAALDRNGRVVAPADAERLGLPRSEWAAAMSSVSTVKVVELWSWDTCTYLLIGPGQASSRTGAIGTGTLVKRLPRHGYGDPWTRTLRGPYFRALGTTTASRLPERAGLSILYPFLPLFEALDSYLTIQSNSAYVTGYASFKRTQPPGATMATSLGGIAGPNVAPFGLDGSERDGLASEQTRIQAGHVYPYDIGPVEMPRAGVDIDKIIATIRGFIELALPAVVQGVVSSDTSGYALNQAAYLSRLAWDPLLKNAQFALSKRVGFESKLIDDLGEKVYAWGEAPTAGTRRRRVYAGLAAPSAWLGVGPDELAGAHRYTVTLDPETPANRTLEVRLHAEMVDAQFESRSMAIEALGGDPAEVEREIVVENYKRSDAVMARLNQRIQQRLGLGDQQLLAQIGAGEGGAPQLPPQLQALLAALGPGGPGAGPGGPPGAGGPPGGGTSVFSPGYGMAETPTPAGAVSGMGPRVGRQGPPGLTAGNPPGTPVQPNTPPQHVGLPGQS